MTEFVSRTCTVFREQGTLENSRPIESFQDRTAYVLLGAPGAGKTTVFEQEAKRTHGHYVTARDFVTFDDRPEWHDTSLYIDGLDEMRAGAGDGHTPFDSIRRTLERLQRPPFRLSCREADWLGAIDSQHLETVSRAGEVVVLRLDPLSEDSICEILNKDSRIKDPDRFMVSAREKGVDAMLTNPQCLQMLVDAVSHGNWPQTRMGTFDAACRILLREHNLEHLRATPNSVDNSRLMNVAGQLCAVQLLTGKSGYTLIDRKDSPDSLNLGQVPGEDREILRLALGSKLFEVSAADRITATHRQIAEYLAAGYLARLIDDGLPLGRVLALMTGHDGGVVSELRGLAAWLAAHCKSSREQVVTRAPLETVLYGDVREFSTEDKRMLLEALFQEVQKNPWMVRMTTMDSRLGDMVTPDVEELFRGFLADPRRDEAQQSFILVLVEMLVHGPPHPGFAGLTLQILRDRTWRPTIRYRAVSAYVRHEDCIKAYAELIQLVDDVEDERMPDPDDDLLGALLTELYPSQLSVYEVIRHLRTPKNTSYLGDYYLFWTQDVPEKSTPTQLGELLDEFVAQESRLCPKTQKSQHPDFFLHRVPLVLLSRFLQNTLGAIDAHRLYRWLGAALGVGDWNRESRIGYEERECIASQLSSRPELLKELFLAGLEHCVAKCTDESEFKRCMYMEKRRVPLKIERPPDFGSWCIDQAMATTDDRAARYLLQTALDDLPLDAVNQRISGNVRLLHLLHEIPASRDTDLKEPDLQQGWKALHDRKTASQNRREAKYKLQQEWRDRVKSQESELRECRGQPELLYPLAVTYFGGYSDIQGSTPRQRLQDLLGDDQDLVEVVLESFRGALKREDLPTDFEIIQLSTQNRIHLLALPIMVGLEEMTQTVSEDGVCLEETQVRLVLAIHYTTPVYLRSGQPADSQPRWLQSLLESSPDTASDILVQYVRAKLRKNAEFGAALHNEFNKLVHTLEYAGVARQASVPLLQAFPVRCTKDQLRVLDVLLLTARLHAEPQEFLELIEKKLAYRSMNVAQRIYWLANGLLASPNAYLGKLHDYVAGNERRILHLMKVVAKANGNSPESTQRLGVSASRILISLIGSSCRPYSLISCPEKDVIVTPSMQASDCTHGYINRLASNESKDAKDALSELLVDEGLRLWRPLLIDAAYQQNKIYRDASFHHSNIEQVIEVLSNRHPANAADLAALTVNLLTQVSQNIRNGNTSDWRQYWKFDDANKPCRPMHEDDCRDRLLSDLRLMLKIPEIDVQPEGRYADDKRSDIRVSCYGFNVPVEIKKSCHRDLWSAIREQLIAKYTRDPGSDGYGIYLVLWFGNAEQCRPTPGTQPPARSALELKEQLCSQLSSDQKRKISVCVIDVAKPSS